MKTGAFFFRLSDEESDGFGHAEILWSFHLRALNAAPGDLVPQSLEVDVRPANG